MVKFDWKLSKLSDGDKIDPNIMQIINKSSKRDTMWKSNLSDKMVNFALMNCIQVDDLEYN